MTTRNRRWSKVGTVHHAPDRCDGELHSYAYRFYRPQDELYHRCVALSWCSRCREYSGAMVHVPADRHLPDPLADLPEPGRERLRRSEVRLLDHLDRLVRRGLWP